MRPWGRKDLPQDIQNLSQATHPESVPRYVDINLMPAGLTKWHRSNDDQSLQGEFWLILWEEKSPVLRDRLKLKQTLAQISKI